MQFEFFKLLLHMNLSVWNCNLLFETKKYRKVKHAFFLLANLPQYFIEPELQLY